jgi:hypothetical protein
VVATGALVEVETNGLVVVSKKLYARRKKKGWGRIQTSRDQKKKVEIVEKVKRCEGESRPADDQVKSVETCGQGRMKRGEVGRSIRSASPLSPLRLCYVRTIDCGHTEKTKQSYGVPHCKSFAFREKETDRKRFDFNLILSHRQTEREEVEETEDRRADVSRQCDLLPAQRKRERESVARQLKAEASDVAPQRFLLLSNAKKRRSLPLTITFVVYG